MDVREVRMPVLHLRMKVRMRVRLHTVAVEVMRVLMVVIMAVQMDMRQRHVLMGMRMVLREVQPDTGGHQPGGNPEHQVCRLPKQCHRKCSPNKGGDREIRAGTRCTQATQGENEKNQAQTVPHEASQQGH